MLVFLTKIVDIGSIVYCILILGRVLANWIQANKYNPITNLLFKATEPFFLFIRDQLPLKLRMFMDISALVALISVIIIRKILLAILLS